MTVNYRRILTLEIIGFLTAVIYDGKLRRYFYNIATWGLCYKNTAVNYRGTTVTLTLLFLGLK
jgi:hypothetical protein